ncbi:MTAP family purine nucleoside phosphorylase [Paenactinomyces guangxiensis]|uniref:MTAP family purine nucleoside phosphorylase n=1 Tax=Paenactinomyces guangxiensis TaxID=1490290 RepID=A0A7W1WP49_9BACL|nr:MTAP family purine nucleoside phosphorylase [Paenactinomyces guangxiensis]MBA4493425.1 MTAP family purine nucleoside phosphorylase [Paenactinomyces guangxiensis]MBH8590516.1 MTAP family purine nucleoside phosphorylase [Paenactinomyces guangxiensis]
MVSIPQVDYAIIGGSSTFSIRFPEDLGREDTEVLEKGLVFETPYGESPSFKRIRVGDKEVLTCRMHGWRPGVVTRGQASKQIFWVFQQAGVKKIFVEGGVGAINHLLELRDIVIPDDYIDHSMRQDVGFDSPYLLVMRDPICPNQRDALYHAAKERVSPEGRYVFKRGIYVNTDGRHFESRAEVQMFRGWHADVVGQSITPEVYLAREIGACYAGIYMVVNYAEGIIRDWEHKDLKDIFYNESKTIGHILLDSLYQIDASQETCPCLSLRKETLLQNYFTE